MVEEDMEGHALLSSCELNGYQVVVMFVWSDVHG